MDQTTATQPGELLLAQLRWFTRLRWLAGCAVIAGAAADAFWIGFFPHAPRMAAIGAAILLYNVIFWLALRRTSPAPMRMGTRVFIAWAQIILDLACLTMLTCDTGGIASPLLGFFVLHMVFASLFFSRRSALGGAATALAMMQLAMLLNDQWPASPSQRLVLGGWVLSLLAAIYITSAIVHELRRQRRHLLRKNRRISAMKDRLEQHQQTIVQQEKMVAMGQMAAGVAHEIANPLASMDSVLQLMLRKPDKLTPEGISTLRQQVGRIHQIVKQMTSFAHPSQSSFQIVPINHVVEETLKLMQMDARARQSVKIDLRAAEDAGDARIIPNALQQVLINLLFNALDATAGASEPRISIRTAREGRWCVIEVADNGHGIKTEHLHRVFEPFFTTKEVGQGTGLGLSISYNLVRKQGGQIEVRSAPNEGAVFTVRVPADESAVAAPSR